MADKKLDLQPLDLEPIEDNKLSLEPIEDMGPEISASQAALLGGARGLSGGWSDALEAATGTAGYRSGLPEGQEDPLSLLDRYRQIKQDVGQEHAQAAKQHPTAYKGAELSGGLVLGALAPGGMAGSVGTGAAVGLGTSQADLTNPAELPQALKDTAIGAGLGFGGQLLGESASEAIKKLPAVGQSLEREAGFQALQSLGGKTKAFKEELGAGKALRPIQENERGIGQEILNQNALPAKGGAEAVVGKIDDAINRTNQELNPIMEAAQNKLQGKLTQASPELGNTNAAQMGSISDDLRSILTKHQDILGKSFGGEEAAKQINKDILNYIPKAEAADFNLSKLNELKQTLGKQLRDPDWLKASSEMPANKAVAKDVYFTLKNRVEKLADLAGDDMGQKIKDLNARDSRLYSARELAFENLIKQKAKPSSLMEPTGLGIAGGVIGGTVGGYPGAIIGTATGTIAQKGIEAATGNKLSTLSRVANARGLKALGEKLSSIDPEASQGLLKLIDPRNPDSASKLGVLTRLYKEPEYKNAIDSTAREMSEQDKDVPSKRFESMSEDQLINTSQKARVKYGDKNPISPILDEAAKKDQAGRNALMFTIMQNPSYRKLMGDLHE